MERTEKIFSYGTLRYKTVQLANFGRELEGVEDSLLGFELSMVKIQNPDVIAASGEDEHPIITHTGLASDSIDGIVFDISFNELQQADSYEVADYNRINVQLKSGAFAWVYVNAQSKALNE